MKFATGDVALLLKRHFPGRIGATPDMERTRMDGMGWTNGRRFMVRVEGRNAITATVAKQYESESRKEDGAAVASPSFISSFLSFPNLAFWSALQPASTVSVVTTRE